MELGSSETTQDKSNSEVHAVTTNEVLAPVDASREVTADQLTPSGGFGGIARAHEDNQGAGKVDAFGEVKVNADAFVASDDVIRAGGFGATDDISSFLPVAIDFTDFEANLRGAREYEDLNEKINRPGLGWTGQSK